MLSNRLKAIVAMVPECQTVADIGCDHGKVAVWLLKNGRVKLAICGDISARSLDKARKLASAKGLSSALSARVGNGFDVVDKGESQCAILAGMGGELMMTLLAQGIDKLPDTLVLSCNKSAGLLRKWICENGYLIDDEDIVLENRHFYPVMRMIRGVSRPLTEAEIEFGPILLKKKPKLLKLYVKDCINKAKDIRTKLVKSEAVRKDALIAEIDEKIQLYSGVEQCL